MKRRFLGIFLSMFMLLQIGIIPSYALATPVEENFNDYTAETDLSDVVTVDDTTVTDNSTVTTVAVAKPTNDSPFDNSLKITETSPNKSTWYPVDWKAATDCNLSGKIQVNFSVYVDGTDTMREFAIITDKQEISFLSFRAGNIQRVDPTKLGEARTAFSEAATYDINTWYNVEFKYDFVTGDYYVVVTKDADDSLVASESLNLKSDAAIGFWNNLDSTTMVKNFQIQSRRTDQKEVGPSVYIDNLSIKTIFEDSIFVEKLEENFSNYNEAEDLASSFSAASGNTVSSIDLSAPTGGSSNGNALKITEKMPTAKSWYNVDWTAVSGCGLNGEIQANFSVYIEGDLLSRREFAIFDGTRELSFLSFNANGTLARVDPTKNTEARTAFTKAATYQANTWYDVEFRYDTVSGDYYVAVTEDGNVVAEDEFNLKAVASANVLNNLNQITEVDGFQFQSRQDTNVDTSVSIYVDNLSIKNTVGISAESISYTTKNGKTAVSALADNDVQSRIVVTGPVTSSTNLKAILALYENGNLAKVKFVPIVTPGVHKLTFDEEFSLAADSDYRLVTYVWNGDLTPYGTDAGILN